MKHLERNSIIRGVFGRFPEIPEADKTVIKINYWVFSIYNQSSKRFIFYRINKDENYRLEITYGNEVPRNQPVQNFKQTIIQARRFLKLEVP